MGFTAIQLEDYVELFLKSNPREDRLEATARLEDALAAFEADIRCDCGERIWVIGSAEVGNRCFTCITGEAYPEDDYEIAEACARH